jgi:peptidoglycan-associated lipoprotein
MWARALLRDDDMRKATIIVVGVALLGGACSKNKTSDPLGAATSKRTGAESRTATTTGGEAEGGGGAAAALDFGPIYFEYDEAQLRADSKATLERLATYLEVNPQVRVTIAGNADERGTPEYNIALGQERADAVRKYLVRLGVPEARVSAMSYGEENPAVEGQGEAAWAKNRRAELVLEGASASR